MAPWLPTQSPITIVLADDHAVVRSGLRLLLDAEDGLEVVAEAGDAESALRDACSATSPTVLVLDLNMPGEPSSLEAIPRVHGGLARTRASSCSRCRRTPAFAREALRAGAVGYVLKEAADDELVEAVRPRRRGETYLNPRLGAALAAAPPARRAARTTSPSARSRSCG